MNELDFAEKTIEIAREIRKISLDKDVINRAIVSRLYYAAHHAAKLLLKLRGYDPDSWIIETHQKVINEIEKEFVNSGMMMHKTLSYLSVMKSKRAKADYNLRIRLQEQEVDRVFRLCEHFIRECKQLQGVI